MSFTDGYIKLNITSIVKYWNGNTETGPSTTVKSEVATYEAVQQVLKLMKKTVDDLHTTNFGSKVRHAVLEFFEPTTSDWDDVKLEVIYTVSVYAKLINSDGELEEKNDSYKFVKPI